MSVSDIISERALIQQRLLINPSDIAAAALLRELDSKVCVQMGLTLNLFVVYCLLFIR